MCEDPGVNRNEDKTNTSRTSQLQGGQTLQSLVNYGKNCDWFEESEEFRERTQVEE